MHAVVALAGAAALGLLFRRLRVPGGLLVGAMIGSAAVTIAMDAAPLAPPLLAVAAPLGVGLITGVMVNREILRSLKPMIVPALVAGLGIIAAGLLIAGLLDVLGVAPPAAVLATSPGALSVMIASAIDHGAGEVEVALFHVVRLIAVMLLSPALVWGMRRFGGEDA